MVLDILKSAMILMSSFVLCAQAFWWSRPTTESPPPLKQIPIGYFRTYTYQPLTYPGSYSSYSYMGSHQSVASPFLDWTQRQTIANPSPGLSGLHLPPVLPPNHSPLHTQPLLPPTQPPHYPTTSSLSSSHNSQTSTTQHPQTESQAQSSHSSENKQQQQQQENSGSSRPKYSPPDPSNYQYQYPGTSPPHSYQNVQFVPCMCPVTVTVSDLADGRSAVLTDDFDEENGLLTSQENIH